MKQTTVLHVQFATSSEPAGNQRNEDMFNEGSSATRKVLSILTAGLVFGAACDENDQPTAEVKEAVLVGASGHFYANQGDLRIDVSPKDAKGNFVGQHLPKSAFSFANVTMQSLDDDKAAPIAVNAQVKQVDTIEADPDAALRAVMIFDSSGSMADNDPEGMGRRLGGKALFDVLRPNDQVSVLDFGPSSTPPLDYSRVLQDFTNDRTLLDASLNSLTEDGGTPLYESILEGLDLLIAKQDSSIPALVVLTDGIADDDNDFQDVIEKAQNNHIPIYAIGLGKQLDYRQLTELTEQTGGSFIEASDAMGLEHAFAGVSSGIRLGAVTVTGEGMYVLTDPDSRYRISGNLITTTNVNGKKEDITTPFTFTVDIEEDPKGVTDPDDDTGTDGDGVTVPGTWGGSGN
ncbi:MAG: VWA domain-containing protein [Myxococcales bacterium]